MGKRSRSSNGPKHKGVLSKNKEQHPIKEELTAEDSEEEQTEEESSVSVYDSEDGYAYGEDDEEEDDDDDDDSEDEFEDQGSSDEDEDLMEAQKRSSANNDDDDAIEMSDNLEKAYERAGPRTTWKSKSDIEQNAGGGDKKTAKWMHTDDLSSDDEDQNGTGNRIGRVPLHWYDDYDHIGYDVHGSKVTKTVSSSADGGDRIDQVLADEENKAQGKLVVHDALNDKNIELSARQLELIRRVQAGAFAHPEHESNPEYVDYFSGVNPEISGLNSNRHEPKARFQPSQWEKLQVDKLLDRLEKGHINMDYLTGKVRDMNDVNKKKHDDKGEPFLLWKGDEEDELNMRKGPQHIAAPKVPPPGHAESYRPPDEYLPTEDDLKKWEEMEVHDRPHGRLIPRKFPNLRSVGAYEHTVTETFERCLDLYLCPRVLKRRLNIDPESLVPQLPKANDLRPFPTAKCIEYKTPYDKESEDSEPPMIRCVACSPDGQFMASGATDGYVRLWEVQTGRLLRSWNVSECATELEQGKTEKEEDNLKEENDEVTNGDDIKPIVSLEWNPNRMHHCLLAAVGKCVIVIATGTACGQQDAEITDALLASAAKGGNVTNMKAAQAVSWNSLVTKTSTPTTISAYDRNIGPICALLQKAEVAILKWQAKGDYFVSVAPKATGGSAVLIHQLSKGNSQKPFGKKSKGGENQLACFHPNKPFLFVANQQHIRVYHLVKQSLVKRLLSGCRHISSLDIHPSGDHLLVGSLDRKLIWFDLDLGHTPYKTLKYHERGLRCVKYHTRYPLMASCSDDATIHIFHSMVYSDLMRNPLIVPVKILRGHTTNTKNRLGVLTIAYHTTQPWIFTGGADGKLLLYQDI